MADLIIVPGGGVCADGSVPEWVRARLDRALEVRHSKPILLLSALTVHKAAPIGADGRPVFEAVAGARYLVDRGLDPSQILTEIASYDTIGNAFFARLIHTELGGWRRLTIVNSAFHMARTEAVFRWVFGLTPDRGYELTFDTVPDVGMPPDDLAIRYEHESRRLHRVHELRDRIESMAGLHRFLYRDHDCYSTAGLLQQRKRDLRLERVY